MTECNNIDQFLLNPTAYTSININHKNLADNDVIKLMNVLKSNQTVTYFNLYDNKIGDAGAIAIGQGLAQNQALTYLGLHHNQIGDAGAAAIAHGLAGNKALRELYLHHNQIGDAGATAIAQGLAQNQKCIWLYLDHNQIGDAGAVAIGQQALAQHRKLEILHLDHNQIGDAGAAVIGKWLVFSYKLTQLNLGHNQIGDAGAAAIGQRIAKNKTLTKLCLIGNQIGDAGATAIGEGLAQNQTLTWLELRHNQIGDVGATAIGQGIAGNKALTYLDLNWNCISQQIVGDLQNQLSRLGGNLALCSQSQPQEQSKLNKELPVPTVKNVENDAVQIFKLKGANIQSNSELDKNIKDLLGLLNEGNDRIQTSQGKSMLLMGNTGAGKSTFAHVMKQAPLQAIEDDETGDFIVAAQNPTRDLAIGLQHDSETNIPNLCRVGDLNIWDCPGFGDTKIIQEIANVFYIQKLFEINKKMHFVLLIPEQSLKVDRGTHFINTIKHFIKSFSDISLISNNISLIVTKSPPNKKATHIEKLINRVINENQQATQEVKDLVSKILGAKMLSLFNQPSDEGPVDYDYVRNNIISSASFVDAAPDMANIIISAQAEAFSKTLLATAKANFAKIGNILVKAMLDPIDVSSEDGTFFVDNSDFVRSWLPEFAINFAQMYQVSKTNIEFGNFPDLALLKDIKAILQTKDIIINADRSINDSIVTEMSVVMMQKILSACAQFTEHQGQLDLSKSILENSYVLKQQFDYVRFFSSLCNQKIELESDFAAVLNMCSHSIENHLKAEVESMEFKLFSSIEYYEEAIKYLDLYPESDVCGKLKSKAYVKIGDLSEALIGVDEAINYYMKAIKLDYTISEIYDKLGAIYTGKGDYKHAIICYNAVNNFGEIQECFKEWIKLDKKNPDIMMMRGDYLKSTGQYSKAVTHYNKAIRNAPQK